MLFDIFFGNSLIIDIKSFLVREYNHQIMVLHVKFYIEDSFFAGE